MVRGSHKSRALFLKLQNKRYSNDQPMFDLKTEESFLNEASEIQLNSRGS